MEVNLVAVVGLIATFGISLLWASLRLHMRHRRLQRRRPLAPVRLTFTASEVADHRRGRQTNWLTGRYKGGLTAGDWAAGRSVNTLTGPAVRSSNEARIAAYLDQRGLRYVHEPEICGFRPDFYLPGYGIAIEYWGMQAKGNPKRRAKTGAYLRAGYRLVSLGPGKAVSLEEDLRRQLYYKMQA